MPQILSLQHYLLYHMQPLSLPRNNSAQPFKEKGKKGKMVVWFPRPHTRPKY